MPKTCLCILKVWPDGLDLSSDAIVMLDAGLLGVFGVDEFENIDLLNGLVASTEMASHVN